MPKGKKNGKGGNLSVTKMRINSSLSSLTNQQQVGGTPDRQRVTLQYAAFLTRAPSAGTSADYVFSGNGLFDCDITGTGGQPANYDDFSALYGRYRVYGSSIYIQPSSTGSLTAGTGLFYSSLCARHTTTAISTFSAQMDALTQPFSQGKNWTFASSGNLGTPWGLVFKDKRRTTEVLGYKTSAIDDDDTLAALTSANPNHQWYWHFTTSMVDQTSTGSLTFVVRILYDVEFFDRLDTLVDTKIMRVPKSLVSKIEQEVKTYNQDQKLIDKVEELSTLGSDFNVGVDGGIGSTKIQEIEGKVVAPRGDTSSSGAGSKRPRTILVYE